MDALSRLADALNRVSQPWAPQPRPTRQFEQDPIPTSGPLRVAWQTVRFRVQTWGVEVQIPHRDDPNASWPYHIPKKDIKRGMVTSARFKPGIISEGFIELQDARGLLLYSGQVGGR